MPAPSFNTVFTTFYPGMIDVAAANGYSLSNFGSMTTLVAQPWVEWAVTPNPQPETSSPEMLAFALTNYINDKVCHAMGLTSATVGGPTVNPYNRKSWSIAIGVEGTLSLHIATLPVIGTP